MVGHLIQAIRHPFEGRNDCVDIGAGIADRCVIAVFHVQFLDVIICMRNFVVLARSIWLAAYKQPNTIPVVMAAAKIRWRAAQRSSLFMISPVACHL
ncbi:hypothetical protein BOC60_20205 [Burkholderia pseudomallei]|nr:hypothetical protein BOC60_20205 [Burkholderia pseudomallei]